MTPEKISKEEWLSCRYLKKITHKLRRREIKAWLKGFRKIKPNDKQYLDETV